MFCLKGKAWWLEDEEDLQNVVIPAADLKRDVAAAREALMSSQTDKQREVWESAAQAAALASAVCATVEKFDDEDGDDPLEKFMESIAKEVRGNIATSISTKVDDN